MIKVQDIDNAHDYIKDVINKNLRHEHYERVCDLAKEYRTAITGKNIKEWLSDFSIRETTAQFELRLKLTIVFVTSILQNVTRKFNKITRVSNIRKKIEIISDKQKQKHERMISFGLDWMFEGGYDNFLLDSFIPKTIREVNGFYVTTFTQNDKKMIFPILKFYPVEECVYYEKDIFGKYHYLVTREHVMAKDFLRNQMSDIYDYTIFAGEVILEYKLVSKNKDEDKPENYRDIYKPNETASNIYITDDKRVYQVFSFKPKCKITQVYRVGYIKDPETDEETYISVIHHSLPYIKKLLDNGSTLDLAIKDHAFPKLMSFKQQCQGVDGDICNEGKNQEGKDCVLCHGTGEAKQSNQQDTIKVTFPEDGGEPFDISKIAAYLKNDIEILDFLDKQIEKYSNKVFFSVFNTDSTPHSALSTIGDTITATEVTTTRDDINDTLSLLAKSSEKFFVHEARIVHNYVNSSDDNLHVTFVYPKDLKTLGLNEMLLDLQLANSSKAPHFVIEQLSDDLSLKLFDGDTVAMKRYSVKKRWIPFIGLSEDSVNIAYQNGAISQEDYILYYNQDIIFGEVEYENPNLYLMPDDKIDELIDVKLKNLSLKIKTSNGKTIDKPNNAV